MSTSRIVTVLVRQAQAEHNPYLWDLAKMLYALETTRHAKPQPDRATTAQETRQRPQ